MANSIVLWVLLLLLISCGPPGLNAQDFICYLSPEGCIGTSFRMVNTPGDCCLSEDGLFFESAGQEQCATCFVTSSITSALVFGWLDAPFFTAVEQEESYLLQVGYIKGGGQNSSAARLQFNVIITEGSAVARDFSVVDTNLQPESDSPAVVQTNFTVDGIALEPDETFQLRLLPENEASMPGFNKFLMDTLEVTIIDQDTVSVQFTEREYASFEDGQIQVTVSRTQLIATPMTLRITPMNYTEYQESGMPDLPTVPEFDPYAPNRAKSFPMDRRDFDITPIEIIFEANEFTRDDVVSQISITNDDINEADEFFVVVLEIVDAVNPAIVDLSVQNASLCQIMDNDPIRIGFEFPVYTFKEEDGSLLNHTFLIKEDGRVSEQTFNVSVTTGPVERSQLPNADHDIDYTIGPQMRMIRFPPDQQQTPFSFAFFDDDIPEGSEVFELQSSNNAAPQFTSGTYPNTIVVMEDNDGSFQCYTTVEGCTGDFQMAKNRRDCCLGGGLFYELEGVENCTQCVVFGWLDAPEFIGIEQQEAHSLEVGYIKGGNTSAARNLEFSVEIRSETAVEGSDFTVANTSVSPTPDISQVVIVTFQQDIVALEPNETFQLLLTPENNESLPTALNEFLVDTLDLTIIDQDRVTFQFTEAGYSSPEEEGQVQVMVETNQSIATPVTLRVTAVNISELLKDVDFPSLPVFDPDRPNRATTIIDEQVGRKVGAVVIQKLSTGFPEEQRDFDITPVEVVLEADDHSAGCLIPITDDEVNEAEELFAVLLEVVDAVSPERVDISGQNVSLCFIVDNDSIRIGFESPSHTIDEEDRMGNVFLIKEDGQLSEQTFLVLVTAGPGGQAEVPDATTGDDYSVEVAVVRFPPDQQRTQIQLTIVDDNVTEETEAFRLEAGFDEEGIPFLPGSNPIATVFIEDNDEDTTATVEEGGGGGDDDAALIGGVVGGVVGFLVITTIAIILLIIIVMVKNRQELQPSSSFNYSGKENL